MRAITSSVLEQIGQHIWTCRGTATSFTSECQEIIGECTEEVGLHKQFTWTVRFSSDKKLTEKTVVRRSRTKHHAQSWCAPADLIIIVIFITTNILYDINLFPKAVI